ncbi:alpha/beta hydrolase [Jidongwangia harbinensis]|uniref:alpha/beta hydrolase n=1 Tax=Jidongwangia harbinensis TaxID=2878561 RepID=UPI001CDA0326|nr:alpha/beta hydrolase [Jidongwangia harbinensis]MCA2218324.1 alpha/beta hydrolase [Jidongwangia harbinensis]
MRRIGIVRIALVAVLVAALVLAAAWLGQRRLIYFPDRTAPAAGSPFRDVTLRTEDDLELTAWLLRPARDDRGTAVLVTPGNAGHRAYRAPLATALGDAGFTVLLLDYRGYGGNPGFPTEDGLARDARAARAYLGGLGFGADRLVYFGESLGAAVAVGLAAEHPPAALVLRSPFTDLAATGRAHYPWLPVGLLLRDRYPVADRLARTPVPTTVIYGTADTVVPPAQSRSVAERAAGPVRTVVLPGADHNDPSLTHGPEVIAAVTTR